MLSIPHLIIIFVVALVVFGPEKLPELARNLGKVMAEFRRATGDLRSTFEDHLRDLEREAEHRRIGGGTAHEPPAHGAETIQTSLPAAVPASAPNAPERLENSSYVAVDPIPPSEASNGASNGKPDSGSSAGNAPSGAPPLAEPANAAPEPGSTRS